MAACTKYNSIFLCQGHLFTVGRNYQGILGYFGNPENKKCVIEIKPIQSINTKIKFEGVAAGASHVLAWTENGRLYSWGKASDGCLGYTDKAMMQGIGFKYCQYEPKIIEALLQYDVASAAAGNKHSMCLTRCGKVFDWGKAVRDLKNTLSDFHEPKNPFDQ